MLGEDFYCIIQHDSRLSINFKGVYAANELPSQLPVRGLAIVNCCTLEMFDSFGFGPEMYNLENKLPKSEIIKYNSNQLQHPTSEVCGYYCLYYCYFKSRGHSMEEIVSVNFSNDTQNNDYRLCKLFKKLFNLK